MKKPSNTKFKLQAFLSVCIIGAVIALGISYYVYFSTRDIARTIKEDTVPKIVAANHINALVSNAHSNAMNAMVTKEKTGDKYWKLYRDKMTELHSRLIEINENNVFGDVQKKTAAELMANIGQYEYTLGGSVSEGAKISVDQFGEANRLMQQKILPASVRLSDYYTSYLNTIYDKYSKNINWVISLTTIAFVIFILILISIQYSLFKKTHRIFNIGLLLVTLIFSFSFIYSINSLQVIKSELKTVKEDAYDSIQALWKSKSIAYNANALESLYLLHNGTGIVQTADTINFNFYSESIISNPNAALNGEEASGYLNNALKGIDLNINSNDSYEAYIKAAIEQWAKYDTIDKKIRNLEYDGKHSEAFALYAGQSEGQSAYVFTKFDENIDNAINKKQALFDEGMNLIFSRLNIYPYITFISLILIVALSILGLMPRIEEYKA